MRFGTLFSGIGAPEVAWYALGWHPVFAAEVEAFPSAVLGHHYPDLPNQGDITEVDWREWRDTVDVLIGGSPCQSFSVAGLRGGLDDPRGNLTLEFLQAADRIRPEWLVWENVPGVLSHDGGRSFGAILGALGELGYGWAYRVLDAQYFGVAQRRRRVFLVASARGANPAAAVLLEPESLRGDSAPSREPGEDVASTIVSGASSGGRAHGAMSGRAKETNLIPFDTTQITSKTNRCQPRDGSPCHPLAAGAHAPAVAIQDGRTAGKAQNGTGVREELAYTVDGSVQQAVCVTGDVTHALNTANNGKHSSEDGTGRGIPTIAEPLCANEGRNYTTEGKMFRLRNCVRLGMAVRRLTPRECERLQGFPDDYTAIPWRGKSASECPDGPRYKALGNSMAVPVVRWIGERIEAVRAILSQEGAA